MKKILMGLLAISAISFSAVTPPKLDDTPVSDTPIFSPNGYGSLPVKAKFVSTIPEVRYVMYASVVGGENPADMDTKIQLPNFYITTLDIGSGFWGTTGIPKIYVKKITGSSGHETTTDVSEAIEFKVTFDNGYTALNSSSLSQWSQTLTGEVSPFAFIPKQTLEQLFTTNSVTGVTVDTSANVNLSGYYPYAKGIKFQAADGVLTIVDGQKSSKTGMNPSNITKIESALKGQNQTQNVSVYARVR